MISVYLHSQQGGKGSLCFLTWFHTSSRIIVTNNPWLRLVLTMTTTALILVMAVFNMVRHLKDVLDMVCPQIYEVTAELHVLTLAAVVQWK